MLPAILGAVALGAIGYGVNKCMTDDKCIENMDKNVRKAMDIYGQWVDRFEAYEVEEYPQDRGKGGEKAETRQEGETKQEQEAKI